ncbi:V-type ATP synthase subunit E [bacterium]|nr:V-type ATP synthase subunit E [bacterium]
MPAEAIIKKILDDAKKEAVTVEKEYREELKKIEAEQKLEIEKITADVKKEGKTQGDEKARRLLSNAEIGARKSLLELKQELIDDVFQSAYDHVRKMEDKVYRQFIHDLIIKIAEIGDEEVIVGEKDVKLLNSSFIEQINADLKKAGKKGKLHLGKPSPEIDGGVLLRRGRKEISATLSAIFNEARHELESEVAKILLKEG